MLLRPFLNTISNAYNGLYWVGENILNIPLTQMGQASQLTSSGYSFFDNVSSMVSYQPETIAGRLVKTAMTSGVTSAVFATVVGGGIAASPYVATVAAATSTGLFVVENLFGKGRIHTAEEVAKERATKGARETDSKKEEAHSAEGERRI